MRVTAVGFDLDNTLAVTNRPRDALLTEATEAVSAPSLSRDDYLDVHSRYLASESREPIFDDLLPEESDTSSETLADAYRAAVLDALTPIDGVPNLLGTLRRKYRVGLLTNGPVVAQRSKIDELDWETYFDTTIVTGELDAGKPDRRAFEALCDALDVAAEETVYIGDDPEMDIRGASEVGMATIQVLYPDGPELAPEADACIERDELVPELLDVLSSL